MVFVGDDWAEGHHDIEIMDATGRKPAALRLPDGVEGITRSHALIADHSWTGRLTHAPSHERAEHVTWSPRLHDRQRARGVPHNAALRHLANRLVGILHGCLASRTTYDESTAWAHHAAGA